MSLAADKIRVEIIRDDGLAYSVGYRADFDELDIIALRAEADKQEAPLPLSAEMVCAVLSTKRILGGRVNR